MPDRSASRFQGSLAIRRPRRRPERPADTQGTTQLDVTPEPAPSPAEDEPDPYLTSLAKLFPAEALSALLLVLAIDPTYTKLRLFLIAIIALALIALRYFATRNPDTGKPDVLAIIVSLVSFLIYATALLAFGNFGTDDATIRLTATVIAILWMAILTQIVRKAPPP